MSSIRMCSIVLVICVLFGSAVFGQDQNTRSDDKQAGQASPKIAAVEHPPALSPEESQKQFTVAEGLEISLVTAEPDVTQPLSICFDDRGRMWVLQYRQYPNPNGLKAVEMDNWLRTKYDKVPDPPPQGPRGEDRISIYEDADGDGRMETVKVFLGDLNLASGMALGYDGVFVVQPPYLLYYADANHDDLPDGPPEVLLKGFGMEDAHAFANSLTWGPDGWLYGCQGSTATADIRGIGFQQGVWRYHPRSKEFELFAEGGGNSWGVEFDARGNLFAAGNTVEPLVHHVQGAYYVKGFGKHGPLHNPYAFGYFQPVLHHGYVGDSLTGGAIIYQGGAFPTKFNGACIAPNTRHSACRWSTIELRGSTFATRHAGDFVTSKDIWFRPVDMTVGPDGAVYIADWYDYNISHSSPVNRSQWYQPSRLDGRVWRVAPPDVKRIQSGSIDLSKKSSADLVELLSHPNDWYARQARRIFAERRDQSIAPQLTELALQSEDERLALQGLWSLYVTTELDEKLISRLLDSHHQYVRAWVIRLMGDRKSIPPKLMSKVMGMASRDVSVVVCSQLACTAKRIPAYDGLPMTFALLQRDSESSDVHLPLLLWWAIEDKAITDYPHILAGLRDKSLWQRPLIIGTIIERLARRFMADGYEEGFTAAAQLMEIAPTKADRDRVINGMLAALSGRKLDTTPTPLEEPIKVLLRTDPTSPLVLELALRLNMPAAIPLALDMARDVKIDQNVRESLVKTLGETHTTEAVDHLIDLLKADQAAPIQIVSLTALGYFDDDRICQVVLDEYPILKPAVQSRGVELLTSRSRWAKQLVNAIDQKRFPSSIVSLEQARQMQTHADDALKPLLEKHWGRLQASTPLEMQGRIAAVSQLLGRAAGDAIQGRVHFEKVCASCHKLHGKGNSVGPDLTGAERKNRELLVRNIVDPSCAVREQFIMHIAATKDGRTLEGLLAESSADTITLLDAKNKRTVLNRNDIEELVESPISLMPEKLLDTLTEQQIRDLFAYLQNSVE